jgi:hypothetical protein
MAGSIWDMPGTPSTPPSTQPAGIWPAGAGGGDLFYNGGNYGQTQDWYNTPIGQNVREQDQSLAYGSWAGRMGIANNNQNFNKWFYNQYPNFQQARGRAAMDNPLMTMDQFLATLPNYQQLLSAYNSQSANARGEVQGQLRVSPTARWIPR